MPKSIGVPLSRSCTLDAIEELLEKAIEDLNVTMLKKRNSLFLTFLGSDPPEKVVVTLKAGKIIVGANFPTGLAVVFSVVKLGIAIYFSIKVGIVAGVAALVVMYAIYIPFVQRHWSPSAELVKRELEKAFAGNSQTE